MKYVIAILLIIILLSTTGKVMGNEMNKDLQRGHFSGYVFDNCRVKIEINENYASIMRSTDNSVLVEKFYPVIEVKEGEEWKNIEFGEKFMVENDSNGWHSVAIGMVYEGKSMSIRGFLQYYQKKEFAKYEPLYPLLQLWFNRSTEYKVIWKYEGIKIRHFEIIGDGNGEIQVPYQEGYRRMILENKTILNNKIFRKGQDIIIGYKDGKKMFGLNWEKSKEALTVLRIKNDNDLSMSIESTPQITKLGLRDLPYPIPDSGGGASSSDSDGDGLDDSLEEAGWYIWVCKSGTTWTQIHVTSDPHNPDTDGDYVSDEAEYDHGTNPHNTNTDNDGLGDYDEIYTYGTHGYTWDSDKDGLSDYMEVKQGWTTYWYDSSGNYHTRHVFSNPLVSDTDGDGLSDKEEYQMKLNPNSNDTDGDGLEDYKEIKGWYVYAITSINNLGNVLKAIKNDGDINDYIKSYHVTSNPHQWDTDGDKLRDGLEYRVGSDPHNTDTDGDGVNDLDEYTWGEDATLVNLEGPEGSISYEKKSGEFGIHWYWDLYDENKINKIVFYKDGGKVDEIDNINSCYNSGEKYIGLDAGDIFDGATFVFVAYDTLGNARAEKFHLNSMFQTIAYGLGSLLVKYADQPEIAGRIAGTMRVLEDTGACIAELIDPNKWGDLSAGFSKIGNMIRNEGLDGVWNALCNMYDGIVTEYTEDAQRIGIDPGNLVFKIGWMEGYIGTNILLLITGSDVGEAVADAFRGSVGAFINVLIESGSKLGDFLDSLGTTITDLIKAWRGMGISRHILLISAAFAATYGASQIWPQIFGPLFDRGFGFALMALSVKGTFDQFGLTEELLDSEVAEGATKLAKRAGITEYSKVASDAKNLLGKEKRAIFLKALGREVVSEDELVDRELLKKLMYFIKDDSNDILSGAHEMKFAVDSGIDEVMPFGDSNLKGLVVLKEGTDSWGLIHIVKEHLDEFKKAFGIETEEELSEFLREVMESGTPIVEKNPSGGWRLIYDVPGSKEKVRIIVSDNERGIITAHPYSG